MPEIKVGIGKQTELDKIDIAFESDGVLYVDETIVPIDMHDLVNEFVALGLARRILTKTGSSYILFNKENLEEPDIDCDVSG
jgi:hypothetical protein